MTEQGTDAAASVIELVVSSWKIHATAAIARLGIPDHLASGPLTAAELAAAVCADAGAIARLARAGASLGLLQERSPGRYPLTAMGECLMTSPGSLRNFAITHADPGQMRPLEHFSEAITTGRPAAQAALGQDLWDYYRDHPDEGDRFADAMSGLSALLAPLVTAALDVAPYERIIDVGGGHGTLLRALVAAAPDATGVLFDLPEVVAGGRDTVAGSRIQTAAGNFFDGVPAGGDLYVLQHVLHDWDDSSATQILRNCHHAGLAAHTLAVIELLLPEQPGYWLPFLLDLQLLVEVGGRERTAPQFRTLLSGAGYQLEKIISLPGGQNILLARA
jgi:SAM-dependent methyltransferase